MITRDDLKDWIGHHSLGDDEYDISCPGIVTIPDVDKWIDDKKNAEALRKRIRSFDACRASRDGHIEVSSFSYAGLKRAVEKARYLKTS